MVYIELSLCYKSNSVPSLFYILYIFAFLFIFSFAIAYLLQTLSLRAFNNKPNSTVESYNDW